jgi:hypothetical protein
LITLLEYVVAIGTDLDRERPPLDEVTPLNALRLKIRRRSGQHIGMLATRTAVLASRMYQNVHIGEKGWAKE